MINAKDLLIDALPIIKQFAPTIGAAIGGPIGMAAGYVIPVLANAFEGNPDNLKDLSQKIISHPQCKDILCTLENNHNTFLSQINNAINELAKAEITVKLEWAIN